MRKIMKTKTFYAVAIIALIAVILWPKLEERKRGANTSPVKEEVIISSNSKSINDENDQYKLGFNYPEIVGIPNNEIADKINSDIKKMVEEFIGNFGPEISEIENGNQKSILKGDYVLIPAKDGYASIEFSVIEDIVFAAHPNNYIRTLNYNIYTGERIEISDILNEGGFTKLSSIAKNKAIKELGDSVDNKWINEGTKSKKENYENFLISKDALIIIFNPYQISSYASGVVKVNIPWSELSGIVNI